METDSEIWIEHLAIETEQLQRALYSRGMARRLSASSSACKSAFVLLFSVAVVFFFVFGGARRERVRAGYRGDLDRGSLVVLWVDQQFQRAREILDPWPLVQSCRPNNHPEEARPEGLVSDAARAARVGLGLLLKGMS